MNTKSSVLLYVILAAFVFLTAGGFFITSLKISSLSGDVSDIKLRLAFGGSAPTNTPSGTDAAPDAGVSPAPSFPASSAGTEISTAIIFQSLSAPTLQPQVQLTVNVDRILQSANGELSVYLKIFTEQAAGYSAFDPANVIQVFSPTGENIRAFTVNGQFNSMPPKGAITGSLLFKTGVSPAAAILQIGADGNAKFYEFDFVKRTYRETVVG